MKQTNVSMMEPDDSSLSHMRTFARLIPSGVKDGVVTEEGKLHVNFIRPSNPKKLQVSISVLRDTAH